MFFLWLCLCYGANGWLHMCYGEGGWGIGGGSAGRLVTPVRNASIYGSVPVSGTVLLVVLAVASRAENT